MGLEQPLVSISTLTYNHEEYIDDFINSVLAQTYKNWEIVIGDDCSCDNTVEKLKAYQAKYPEKIKLILNEKNLGITKNAQNVQNACKGKYICTIAGDDLLLPTKLEKQVNVMEKNENINMCFHELEVFYEDGAKSKLFSEINSYSPKNGTIKEMIEHGSFAGACSIMIRNNSDLYYDKRVSTASDWLFFVQSVGDGEFIFIDEVLGKYRRHSSNITILDNENCLDDHILSCAILLTEYPQYISQINKRLSTVLFEKAIFFLKKDNLDYFYKNIISSIKTKTTFKSVMVYLSQKIGINYKTLYQIKSLFK